MIDRLLDSNKSFVSDTFEPQRPYYEKIAAKQTPKAIWIGCADSRVSEDIITGSPPGTLFVHRNIANMVSFNDVGIAALLEYALVHLKIKDIIVCGHTRCGGIAALEGGVKENYIADWLCVGAEAKAATDEIAKQHRLSPADKLEVLTMENVRVQIEHLKQLTLIREMLKRGDTPRLHGWLYRVETGTIDVLINGETGRATSVMRRFTKPARKSGRKRKA